MRNWVLAWNSWAYCFQNLKLNFNMFTVRMNTWTLIWHWIQVFHSLAVPANVLGLLLNALQLSPGEFVIIHTALRTAFSLLVHCQGTRTLSSVVHFLRFTAKWVIWCHSQLMTIPFGKNYPSQVREERPQTTQESANIGVLKLHYFRM